MKNLCSKKDFDEKYCNCLYGFQIYKWLFLKSPDLEDSMDNLQHRKATEKIKVCWLQQKSVPANPTMGMTAVAKSTVSQKPRTQGQRQKQAGTTLKGTKCENQIPEAAAQCRAADEVMM